MLDFSKVEFSELKEPNGVTRVVGTIKDQYEVRKTSAVPNSEIHRIIRTSLFYKIYGELKPAIRKAMTIAMINCSSDSRNELLEAFEKLNALVEPPK